MKILLDESVPVDFRHQLTDHIVHTTAWAGLKGEKNGELIDAAELDGYDVLLILTNKARLAGSSQLSSFALEPIRLKIYCR